CTILSPDYW
nr:immunoglobulin heavy chain junction region [Macaca mulatta]MOY18082.1 immunoglobulin heavy chain junction region [Macaca mulatta]MOY18553.1 immunoglobulin heavy chain junction region [Macaca mulatta]MOY19439.1 immunoglobulin heavy chain junction region [Macaca mulatta]MOY19797.1 immunoglobulin heavy chain junction region [Macaca mulatta]